MAILVIVRRTKLVFKLEHEFDGNNRYMKFERNPIKMTKLWLSFVRQNLYLNWKERLMEEIHI